MKHRWLYIGVLIWFSYMGYAQSSNLVVRHLSGTTDIGQTTINDIYQDENGSMWFATREGVILYNGNRTERLIPLLNDSSSLTSPIITAVCGDGNGHVFVANDEVHCYDLHTKRLSCCWPHIMQAVTSNDSVLYIANAPYVMAYHIANATVDTFSSLPIHPADRINHLDYYPGKLYICTSKGDVVLLNLTTGDSQIICHLGSCISFAREDAEGILWIGTWEKGLFNMQQGQLQSVSLPCLFVRDIAFSAEGSIWVATHQGLFLDTGEGNFSRVRGLSNQSVWRIYVDIEGTLWIGSYFGGIDFLNPISNVYHYWPLPQIDDNIPIINSMIPVDNNQYYLCTEGNGLLLYNMQNNKVRQYLSSKATNIKSSYYDASRHRIYLGLHLNGLCSFDTQTKTYQYYHLPYSPFYQNQVTRSIIPFDDDLLCGTYNGVYRFSRATGQIIPLSDTLNRLLPVVCDMQIDSYRRLWVVGEGIARYDLFNHTVRFFSSMIARTTEHVCIVDDQLYIGTLGYGVWVTDVNNFNPQPIEAIKNKFVHNIQPLPSGQLLIVFTDGIVIYDPHSHHVQTYSYANGMPLRSLYNGACTLLPDSSIMIAGMDGIVMFKPSWLQFSSSVPRIIVDNVYINDKPQIVNDVITLAAHSMLSLDVTTNHYFSRPNLCYTLSSWKNQWIEIAQETSTIRFVGLPAGKHVLRIEAHATNNNELLAVREFVINQRPPFYRSVVAIVVYVLLLAGLIYWVGQRMKRHYQCKAEREMQQKMLMNDDAMDRVLNYISNNLSNDQLNVESLVSYAGVSRTKLFIIVKNSTGLTPNELIIQTRLKKAAELLTDLKTRRTISEVGYDVGFSSPKYFTKCFKEFYHQTPSQYRFNQS